MTNFNKQSSRMSYQFRYIGVGVLILTVMFMVAMKTLPITIAPEQKELVKNGVFSSLLLGLFFIAFARDKTEDERTIYLRLRALAGGFAGAIGYVISKPFINLLFGMPMEVSGHEVAMVMLFTHIIVFYLQKYTGKE